jgi:hypothetical protein
MLPSLWEIAKHKARARALYNALDDGDPENVDPRDYGLPKWFELNFADLDAETIILKRHDFYSNLGYSETWFHVHPVARQLR